MTTIEERFEVPGFHEPDYTGRVLSDEEIAAGKHRAWIGGHWDDHGLHQLEFLRANGLQPGHKLLDVGCGSLRAGRHLIDYLESDNYYGIDANRSVVQAGYDVELTDEQRAKLPGDHLRASDRFGVDFGVQFDVAIAQSVFTHVSLNHVRLCLFRVAEQMRPGGVFYVTFNEQPDSRRVDGVAETKRPKYGERNVFWYYRSDIRWAASFAPWGFRYIGRWGHPGGQRMIALTRLEGGVGPRPKGLVSAPAIATTSPLPRENVPVHATPARKPAAASKPAAAAKPKRPVPATPTARLSRKVRRRLRRWLEID